MKRLKNVWDSVTSINALYAAFLRAAAAKWDRQAVIRFENSLERELIQLQADMRSGAYCPGLYREFMIRDRKPRHICAAPFRDRVVHQAIMAEVEPWLDARFIYHSYACRRGKGAHAAVAYYQKQARRFHYVLKIDIAQYFPSIDRDRLVQKLEKYVADAALIDCLKSIVWNAPASRDGCGIPIGNLTSQVFANLYLNDIDHWLLSDSRCSAYLRYVDDFFLLGDNKQELWELLFELEQRLNAEGLELHQRKRLLSPTIRKVDVLGYQVTRERRWLRNDNGYRAQRRLSRLAKKYHRGQADLPEVKQSIASWLGHTKHADCQPLVTKILSAVSFQRGCAPQGGSV